MAERYELGFRTLDPLTGLGREHAFLGKIIFIKELEGWVAQAVATRFLTNHFDDRRPFHVLIELPGPYISAKNGGQKHRGQDANDGDDTKQLEQCNGGGPARPGRMATYPR